MIGNNGKPFTVASIGGAIATRAIMADLRAGGDEVGGPAPFTKSDRSRFLQALERRDVLEAQTAMRAHLKASQQRWVENSRREWA